MKATLSQRLKKWATELETALAFVDSDPAFVEIKVREVRDQIRRASAELAKGPKV
jgi:hypothetical protein